MADTDLFTEQIVSSMSQHEIEEMKSTLQGEEDDLTLSTQYQSVKDTLLKHKVSTTDIAYLETKLRGLSNINLDEAMMYILQHKRDQRFSGQIVNEGIHLIRTEEAPYGCDDDGKMKLPNTAKFKSKTDEYERIEWLDYIKLKEGESLFYRRYSRKHVIAKVMKKDGVELVLYTEEGQSLMINFLDQYPYKRCGTLKYISSIHASDVMCMRILCDRLFKAGAIPVWIDQSVKDTLFPGILYWYWPYYKSRQFDKDKEYDTHQLTITGVYIKPKYA
eukprot:1004541_1